MLGADAGGNVGGHDAAGDVRHARRHHHHEFGLRQARKIRANREWSFGLAHYDRGRNVERLRAAGAHGFLHHHGDHANQKLHHAEVVENGEKSRDEDDGRQHLEGEDEAETGVLRPRLSEDKARPREGAGKQSLGAFSGLCDRHCPHQTLVTKTAKSTCNATPVATTRHRMALRLVEKSQAAASINPSPSTPVNRPITALFQALGARPESPSGSAHAAEACARRCNTNPR